MQIVSIADLKDHLSRYLKQVRQGEEILIRDRKNPIAKIVPLPLAGAFDEELLSLAASGLVRLPEKPLNLDRFWSMPGPRIPVKRLVAAVVADREEE